jgi:hypothetical protein
MGRQQMIFKKHLHIISLTLSLAYFLLQVSVIFIVIHQTQPIMKKNLFVLAMLVCVAGFTRVQAQTCPTGLQDCYIYGSLSGSGLFAMQKLASVDFSIRTGSYCPAGRVNCSSTNAYTVTVTRVSGEGSVAFGGIPNNASATVQQTFTLGPCNVTQPFSINFRKLSTTTSWRIALTSVENGRVCNSQTYTVTLSDLDPR